MANNNHQFERIATLGDRIVSEVEKAVIGKRQILEMMLTAVFSGGHILVEDYPGLGKTLIAKSLAATLGLEFKRIQFTPDLLPSDITGGYVYDRSKSNFILRQGPIFANIILADEINRASPKTQSALLEAMEEQQVTLEGETMPLPNPFLVIGTQNPIEYEGTFPLPEAQLDRFLIKIQIGYPSTDEELEILERRKERKNDDVVLDQVCTPEELLEMRQAVENIHIAADVERYIIELVNQTRSHKQVAIGASPRGSLALLKLTRAWAALQGRNYVIPDDVKTFAAPALVHRLILKPDLWLQPEAAQEVVTQLIDTVPVPILEPAGK